MADEKTQQRFAQLIAHTFRLKISVLVLALVALFVVWSTLTGGRQKADEVDKDFCQQIVKDPYYWPPGLFASSCEPFYSAQNIIHMSRHRHDNDPAPTETGEKLQEQLRIWTEHGQQFQAYDDRRREAYRINLSLPYTKGPVFLDGALVSDVWPFCALLAISATLALGFRQNCYEIHLAALIQNVEAKDTHARDFALAEFLPGSISEVKLGGRPFFLYKKPIGLSPETLASWALFIVVTLLSFSLLTDYRPLFTERGEEVFSGYYLWLYLISVLLGYLLLKSRSRWKSTLTEVLGGDVTRPSVFALHKCLLAFQHASIRGIRYETIVVALCVILGVGGFCSHWDESTRGYQYFWRLRDNLSDAPVAARCLQIILIAVFTFLAMSLFSVLLSYVRFRRLSNFMRKTRYVGAVFTLIMVGFLVFSVLLTAYGLIMNWYLGPILVGFNYASFLNSQNLEIFPSDLPPGEWVFIASCGLLALMTVAMKQRSTREKLS